MEGANKLAKWVWHGVKEMWFVVSVFVVFPILLFTYLVVTSDPAQAHWDGPYAIHGLLTIYMFGSLLGLLVLGVPYALYGLKKSYDNYDGRG